MQLQPESCVAISDAASIPSIAEPQGKDKYGDSGCARMTTVRWVKNGDGWGGVKNDDRWGAE